MLVIIQPVLTFAYYIMQMHMHLHTPPKHPHTVLMPILTGESGQPFSHRFFLHIFLYCASLWDRPKLSLSSLTHPHQVFLRWPLCLVPSVSVGVQHLTWLASFLTSTCQNYFYLPLGSQTWPSALSLREIN